MSEMASHITGISIVHSTLCSGADQRKHQSSAGLYEGNSPVTGEFPSQRASNAENVSIWWRHHVCVSVYAWSTSHDILTWFGCALFCLGHIIIPLGLIWSIYQYSSGWLHRYKHLGFCAFVWECRAGMAWILALLMYPDHLQKCFDFGHALLIFLALT